MKEKIDRWLDDRPHGEVRFNRNGTETRCTLSVTAQDCYFGVGSTSEAAFDAARTIFQSYDENIC